MNTTGMALGTFPFRLHGMLDQINDTNVDCEGSIVSWMPFGTSFKIHNPEAFESRIIPKYFPNQGKYKSFRRQLQYYGFFNHGRGHFSHPLFLRKQKGLLSKMKHKGSKSATGAGGAAGIGTTPPIPKDYTLLPDVPTKETATESLTRLIQQAMSQRKATIISKEFTPNELTPAPCLAPTLANPRMHQAKILAPASSHSPLFPMDTLTSTFIEIRALNLLQNQLAAERTRVSIACQSLQQDHVKQQLNLAILDVVLHQTTQAKFGGYWSTMIIAIPTYILLEWIFAVTWIGRISEICDFAIQ